MRRGWRSCEVEQEIRGVGSCDSVASRTKGVRMLALGAQMIRARVPPRLGPRMCLCRRLVEQSDRALCIIRSRVVLVIHGEEEAICFSSESKVVGTSCALYEGFGHFTLIASLCHQGVLLVCRKSSQTVFHQVAEDSLGCHANFPLDEIAKVFSSFSRLPSTPY